MTKKVHMPVLLILAITQLAMMGIAGVAASQEDDVIATLNGKPITLEEAQERVTFQIYRLQGNIYFLLKREIENIVDQKLLAEEAARRGLSMDDLLRKEVGDKVPALTEKEVDDYLADHPADAGKNPQNRKRIRIYLSQKARSQRKLDFMASLREKADFKFLLEPPQRPRTTISINGEPWRGNPDAPVTLIHFASFTDKLSSNSVKMIRRLMDEYPDRIKWVHRNFFLINDEKALNAAQMGESAYKQMKFWEFHDRIFAFEGQFTLDDIKQVAHELGLKQHYYDEGEKEGRFLLEVKDDIRAASRAGITTVPVVFVNGLYFSPTFPYDQLKALVSNELIRFADSPNPPTKLSSSKQGGN